MATSKAHLRRALDKLNAGREEGARIPLKAEYSHTEAVLLTELSSQWVYKTFKNQIWPAYKREGQWYICAEDLDDMIRARTIKDERKAQKCLDPEAFAASKRPSHVAVDMVSRKVFEDDVLATDQFTPSESIGTLRELFLERLQVYLQEWDDQYLERRGESNAEVLSDAED